MLQLQQVFQYLSLRRFYALHIKYETNILVEVVSKLPKTYKKILNTHEWTVLWYLLGTMLYAHLHKMHFFFIPVVLFLYITLFVFA